MSDLALDNTGDLLVESDALSLVEGDDAIVQQLTVRFLFVLGEWFLDTRIGIPYFGDILIKNPDLSRVRAIFQETVLTTPGVASLEEFNLPFDGGSEAPVEPSRPKHRW